jgi:hypothetical protein
MFSTGVYVSTRGLRVRNFTSTRTLAWSEVDRIYLDGLRFPVIGSWPTRASAIWIKPKVGSAIQTILNDQSAEFLGRRRAFHNATNNWSGHITRPPHSPAESPPGQHTRCGISALRDAYPRPCDFVCWSSSSAARTKSGGPPPTSRRPGRRPQPSSCRVTQRSAPWPALPQSRRTELSSSIRSGGAPVLGRPCLQ